MHSALSARSGYTEPSGHLAIIDIAAKTSENSCDLGGQPDSVAIDDEGLMLAIAIENERDEDLNDGMLPQLPAGYVMIIPVNDGVPDCGSSRKVDLIGLAEVGADDPEPEFVDFNGAG